MDENTQNVDESKIEIPELKVDESDKESFETAPAERSVEDRLNDLEDLIMVEQAGIIELKKMLEKGVSTTVVSQQSPEGLDDLKKNLEDRVAVENSLSNSISSLQADFGNRITGLENENKMQRSSLENIQPLIQTSLSSWNQQVDERLRRMEHSLSQKVAEIQKPVIDQQIKLLSEKLAQLEIRMVSLEKVIKKGAVIPVILE